MEISAHMDLVQLSERMGGDPLDSQIKRMREALSASEYADTRDVAESEWMAWLTDATATRFNIWNAEGAFFGAWVGETAEIAFDAMVREAGDGVDVDGQPLAGSITDWNIEREAE